MKLTEDEKLWLGELEYRRRYHKAQFLAFGSWYAWRFLQEKPFYKACWNTSCKGFQGTEEDVNCPHCSGKLGEYTPEILAGFKKHYPVAFTIQFKTDSNA